MSWISYLRLVRVGTLFSPGADVVAGMALAGLPWSGDGVRAIAASIAVYAAGMVLNDHADREEDARQRPERPIPSGAIAAHTALSLGLALIAISLLLSPVPVWHGAIALGVLGYDYLFKASALLGALTMGALRVANLGVGATALAATAPTPPIQVALGAYGLYILSVTILGRFEDDPKVPPRAVLGVQTVPPLVAVVAIWTLPDPGPALWIACALALWFAFRLRGRGDRWDQAAIRRSMTWLLLGTMIYTALLCLASDRLPEAGAILVAALCARRISRSIALT